ncbi:MAG: rhomboid family intramembrane serine protease [Actinomycetota bacterium]
MSQSPPEIERSLDESEVEYCYGHPDTPTRLHCTRCDKPICGRCSVPASVGQHCVWCVAEAKKSAPKVRSTMQATSPAVLAIIAINVVVYLIETTNPNEIIGQFGAHSISIAAGEYHRLLTSMFLHAPLGAQFGIFHILFNMYILRIYGAGVEEAFGTARFVALYLVTGFMGGALSYAFGPVNTYGIGASGAVFGVVGVLLAYLYRRRNRQFLGQYLRSLLFFVGINLVFGFVVPGIDNLAHIGGLAGGIALGFGLDAGDTARAGTGRHAAAFGLVAGVGLFLVIQRTAELQQALSFLGL